MPVDLESSNKASSTTLPSGKGSDGAKLSGKFVFANGDSYNGEYEVISATQSNSATIERSGTGVFTSSDGLVYSGKWHNDKMNGKGTFKHPSGMTYEGDFVNGKFHGIGKYSWPDGSHYEGEFRESKLEGQGYFRDPTGQLWSGKFKGKYADRLKFKLNM